MAIENICVSDSEKQASRARTLSLEPPCAGASLALADAGIEMYDLVAACSIARSAGSMYRIASSLLEGLCPRLALMCAVVREVN